MSSTILFRPASPQDDAFLRLLFVSTNATLALMPEELRSQLAEMQYSSRVLSYAASYPSAQNLILSLADATPIGRLLFSKTESGVHLVDIAVLPAFQSQGIGSFAIAHLQTLAGGNSITLQVAPGNPAEALYRRLGFQTVAANETSIQMFWAAASRPLAECSTPNAASNPMISAHLSEPSHGKDRALRVAVAAALLLSAGLAKAQGILTVTPGRVLSTSAGTGTVGYTGDGGAATSATLAAPSAVAYDGNGNLYLADSLNHVVREIATNGTITTVAGTGVAGFGGDGGAATAALLDTPTGVAVDGSGNIYIADSHNQRIRLVSGGNISTVVGTGTPGFSGDGAAASAAQLALPSGVAVDTAGNLYIADRNNQRIRKVSGGTINTLAGDGEELFAGDGGAATAAALDLPSGVAVDTAGNVYIADRNNQRIRVVNTSGIISTLAGSGSASFSGGFSGDGASPTAATLAKPTGVSVDAAGNVYIADTDNQRIRQVGGGAIATIVGSGAQGFGGDSSAASQVNLNEPKAVAPDAVGNLSIGDRLNQRLRGAALPTITFANQGVGVASSPQPVTLANTGTASITVTSTAFTGSYSAAAGSPCGALPITLTAGTSCVENLLYTPLVTGISSGSVIFSGAGVVPQTLLLTGTAIKTATTVTLTASVATPFNGQADLFTAVVNVAGTVPASGTVTFLDGTTAIGSGSLVNGVATLTTSALADGSHNITAVYAGDLNYTGNSSPVLPISVLDFSLNLSTANGYLTVTPGQAGVFTFTVAPVGLPFNVPIVLTATGLPPGATVSFNPQTITLGSTATTFTMTILTLVAMVEQHQFFGSVTIALGLLLLPFSQSLRRRVRGTRLLTLCGLLLLTLGAIGGLTGCGSNNGFLGQYQKSYTVTVTGTATSSTGATLQRSTTVTLVVE